MGVGGGTRAGGGWLYGCGPWWGTGRATGGRCWGHRPLTSGALLFFIFELQG